jgi:DNA-binding transcriptional LysR family regulator
LAELESQLGFKLFERIGNAKRPTKMGRQILPMMEAVVAQSRGLAQAVTDVRSGRLGELRIGVATDMGKLTLAPLIHAFNQAQPAVALDVQAGGYRAMADLLLDDKLDALVCYDAPELTAPGLGRLRLVPPQPLVVVANARLSPLAARRRLTLPELHAEPWCKPRPGTMMHDKLTALFLGCDLGLPPRGIQVSDLLLTDEFVRTTDYLVMLPLAAAERLTVAAEAVILPVELREQNPPTVVVWQRAAERQTPLHRFLQFCETPVG